jgi:hypothetical protein
MEGAVLKVLERAEDKVRARAYTHWYSRHGLEEQDWQAAFEGLRRVAEAYRELGAAAGGGRAVPSRPLRRIRDYEVR